jgi:hypothetical protein
MSWARPEREWWRRGHRIVRFSDGRWRWAATGRFIVMGAHPTDPPCTVCHLPPTPEGHDPCLGTLEGVASACCGHGGIVEGYRVFADGTRLVTAPRAADPRGPSSSAQPGGAQR